MLEDLKTFIPAFDDDFEPLGKVGLSFEGWKKGEMTDEHRKNLSIAASKRIRTKEHLAKLHEGRRNSKNSLEHLQAIKKSMIGYKHSEETKLKIKKSKAGNELNKITASKAGKASALKRKDDMEYKKAQSEKMKQIWAKRKEGFVNGD